MPARAVTGAGRAVGTTGLWVARKRKTCRRDTASFLRKTCRRDTASFLVAQVF
jgi:hypothetical protein